MARWAIGDVQGCDAELGELLARIRFEDARDQLWFTGDLVNRTEDTVLHGAPCDVLMLRTR